MFTDNQDPVNLIAVDMKTGEQVASMPVIDELPEGTQVSVENSAIVYDDGEVQEVRSWEKQTMIPQYKAMRIFMMWAG